MSKSVYQNKTTDGNPTIVLNCFSNSCNSAKGGTDPAARKVQAGGVNVKAGNSKVPAHLQKRPSSTAAGLDPASRAAGAGNATPPRGSPASSIHARALSVDGDHGLYTRRPSTASTGSAGRAAVNHITQAPPAIQGGPSRRSWRSWLPGGRMSN